MKGLVGLAPRTTDLADEIDDDEIPDDRLRLIFTCCHPALAPEARVALTLRTLGGLSTVEVGRAFLTSEPAMAQRLVRAKRRLRDAGVRYETPGRGQMGERLGAVLGSVYLIFNEGYSATAGEALVRRELTAEAIRLGRLLATLLPRQPEVHGLLALMLLSDSRRDARVDAAGEIVLLADQDRGLWDRGQIAEGLTAIARGYEILVRSQGVLAPGPYLLQATIASLHARAERAADTDWAGIVSLYDRLREADPSPVISLNRAVAVAMRDEDPAAALELIEALEGLDRYQPFHAARADLLRRARRVSEAIDAYRSALELSENPVERRYLAARVAELSEDAGGR
jgi:RNA polymerase sigma-70 factor, ECF subfamily